MATTVTPATGPLPSRTTPLIVPPDFCISTVGSVGRSVTGRVSGTVWSAYPASVKVTV